MASLRTDVLNEIEKAKSRVYALFQPTPLETYNFDLGFSLWLKREDLSPVRSYKWRGAYNAVCNLTENEKKRGIVTASAGNHAQGVAATASKLGLAATVFMPETVPQTKREAVLELSQGHTKVVLSGQCYDDAFQAARAFARERNLPFIHPYDDVGVMGGQGTLAVEIAQARGPQGFDVAFLQIGGGGMAAAVGLYLKTVYPKIRLIGVEAEGQASMQAALKAGKTSRLKSVDRFCDGTAVKEAGEACFALCRELLNDLIVVSNQEVCAAMKLLWETERLFPEPSGALGLAGILKHSQYLKDLNVLGVVTGGNMDFSQIAQISQILAVSRERFEAPAPESRDSH